MKRRLWALLLTLAVTLTLLPAPALAAAFDPQAPDRVPAGVQVYTFEGGVSHSGQTRLRFLWAAEDMTYIAMEVQRRHEAGSLTIRDGQTTYTGEALGTYDSFTIAGEDIPLMGGQKWQVLCYQGGFTPGSSIEAEITAGGHELTPATISGQPGYGPDLGVSKSAALLREGGELDAAAVAPRVGETIRYTVLVTNGGDAAAETVTVTDSMWGLAPRIEAVAVDGETRSVADGALTLDTVPAGAVVTITYDYTVPAELAGQPIRNTAAIDDGSGETEDSVETPPVEAPGDPWTPLLPPDLPEDLRLPAVTVTCDRAAVCGGTDVRATPRVRHFTVAYGPDKRTAVLTPDRAFDGLYEQVYALQNGEGHRAAETQNLRLTAAYDDANGWQIDPGQTPVFLVTCDGESGGETADVTVEHYLQREDGSYTVERTQIIPAPVGVEVTAQKLTFDGYELDLTHPDTVRKGVVLADGSLVLRLFYSRDVEGGAGETPGDGTPDRYQKRLTFRVVHGAWNDGTAAAVEKLITLTDSTGAWSDTGSYTVTAADVPAVGARPHSGYRAGSWDVTPLGRTVTDDAVFTYAYAKQSGGNSDGGGNSGGGSSGGGNGGALNTKDHYSYLVGYQDNRLRPYGPITRGEAATIFFRLLTDEARADNWCQTNGYTDVPPDLWCCNAISTLTRMGILGGYQDGTFQPYGTITRAQFAKLAVGFFETARRGYQGTFPDVAEDAWYAGYVEAAARVGLLGGFEDGTFRPDEPITRAQACVIVNRALGRRPHEAHLLPRKVLVTWPDCGEDDWFYADMVEATNSHDYRWTTEKIDGERVRVEEWTKKLPQRHWGQLEHAWSTAWSAPGGEVMGD